MTTDTRWVIASVVTVALGLSAQTALSFSSLRGEARDIRGEVQDLRRDVRAELAAVAGRIDTLVYEVAAVKAQHP